MGACKRKRSTSKKYNLRKRVQGREKTPEGISFSVLLAKHRSTTVNLLVNWGYMFTIGSLTQNYMYSLATGMQSVTGVIKS